MATIVAFGVKTREQGEEALDRLEGVAEDAALVYKTRHGKVKVQQSSDITAGKGALRGGLIGAAVSIFAGPLVGMTAAGTALGIAYGALRDKGVPDKIMKLAGKQLEDGHAAVFVLADDNVAKAIESAVRESGMEDVEVGSFSEDAEKVVLETLKTGAANQVDAEVEEQVEDADNQTPEPAGAQTPSTDGAESADLVTGSTA